MAIWKKFLRLLYTMLLVVIFLMMARICLQSSLVMQQRAKRLKISFEELKVSLQLEESFIPRVPSESSPKKPPTIPRSFPIEEEDFCQGRPGLDYIVYVHSAIKNVEGRNATRMTWANENTAAKLGVKMGVVYVVGKPKDKEEEQILTSESKTYHDIVQGDFGDYYKLLTYKGLAALEWITRNCHMVPWTIHADDDILVDIVLMNRALKQPEIFVKDQFICWFWSDVPVQRSGKWAINIVDFPEDSFPPYCTGPFWALQTRNLRSLLDASQRVNFLWVDDVYITGLLVKEVGSIGRTWLQQYYYELHQLEDSHIGNTVVWNYERGYQREHWNKLLDHYNQSLENYNTSK